MNRDKEKLMDKAKQAGIRILIAGGGTGGHVFPAVAIAEEFLKRDERNTIAFVGTERGIEAKILPEMGFDLHTIDITGVRGKSISKCIEGFIRIPKCIKQSYVILRNFSPHIVIGVGGYASGPAMITAHLMGIRTAIAEQNSVPGSTNRILGIFADKIFLSFPETKKWFSKKKVVVTGNPLRSAITKLEKTKIKRDNNFTLLIFGGSQGASSINRVIVESLGYLQDLKDKIKVIHQTGKDDLDEVSRAYRNHGMDILTVPFINDMASAYQSSDLLICRAGATSIAEIMASGKASLLIPFPFAVGNHQVLNALTLVNAGAAEMILDKDLDGKHLAERIKYYVQNPVRIKNMEDNARKLGNKNAASDIVDECLAMIA